MKYQRLFLFLIIAVFFTGCIVYSFYPLYTEDDLFANDLLTGEWVDTDSTVWNFEHPVIKKDGKEETDNTSYTLYLQYQGQEISGKNIFDVHIIELEGYYFLDFYLEDYGVDNFELFDFHIIPVHTFAKLTFMDDSVRINWFNQSWLEELIGQNKMRVHHENNGDVILLTAKPKELQKFLSKYVNSEEAFKDGLEAELTRL